MSKVTGKFQVTLPKRLVTRYGIKVGAKVEFCADGDRIVLRTTPRKPLNRVQRLREFDRATERQRHRQSARSPGTPGDRGWTRDELYSRGRSR